MRRRSRECAMQMLYQLDINQQLTDPTATDELDQAIEAYWKSFDARQPVDREFAERLVRGVIESIESVDASISEAAQNWKIPRMAKVDRNLIRVAAYEILQCPDIPVAASINEALEIAKRFSGKDSVPFINGVLDQLRRTGGAEESTT